MKICSVCEERYDRDNADYQGGIPGYLICNKCYHEGKKPKYYPEHWTWTPPAKSRSDLIS